MLHRPDTLLPSATLCLTKGSTVTPGLIAVNTALGLLEVSSVDGSVDNKTHNSGISASFDVQYGLNPASTLIPIARLGGVTHAVVMPDYDDSDKERELPFAGKAALISLGEGARSAEHTSELQSLMRISYAVFFLQKKKQHSTND